MSTDQSDEKDHAEAKTEHKAEHKSEHKAKTAQKEKRNPRTTAGISDGGGNVEYIDYDMPDGKPQREITVNGERYEAVSSDEDGVRIYRHLG